MKKLSFYYSLPILMFYLKFRIETPCKENEASLLLLCFDLKQLMVVLIIVWCVLMVSFSGHLNFH